LRPEHHDANQQVWNQWADLHVRSESSTYHIEEFRAGRTALKPVELAELRDVRGKSLLHLQCHFGLDTLSWAREGAIVTGVDFSPVAIEHARSLAAELGIPARFIESDVFDLASKLDEQFDIVFTSYGALCWLKDIDEWGRVVARHLRPGGTFYIVEFHPILNVFENTPDQTGLTIEYSYFYEDEPFAWPVEGGSYAAKSETMTGITYEWSHPLSDVVMALLKAGLAIENVQEYPYCIYKHYLCMTQSSDGFWRLVGKGDTLPLMFSIRARKPA
jgi:SAM-dependent methyltransferase